MDIGRRVKNLESDRGGNQSSGWSLGCGKGVFLKKGMSGYCLTHQSKCWTRHAPKVWAGVEMLLEAREYGLPEPDYQNPSPERIEAVRQQLISEGKEIAQEGEESSWAGVDVATIVGAVRILENLGIDLSDPNESQSDNP